jgi:hypothetical protein
MSKYCSTRSPDWIAFRKKFDADFYSKTSDMDTGQTLYIDTRYVVLYNTPEQRVDIEQVRASHNTLNTAFSANNLNELDTVPDNERYPWKPLIGNPNIQFLPLDPQDLVVEYREISTRSLSDASPVEDAATRAGVVPGVMNIYIGNNTRGILGQAELGGNIVFSLYSSLGDEESPGELSEYALSKTMIHEVGHALSLPHTFSDDVCDHNKVFPDVPEQISPNFNTKLFQTQDGSWDCKDDSRYTDRVHNTVQSCLNVQAHPDTAPNEMGINYMDYGVDEVSIMFTRSQALMMRAYLEGEDNTTLTLYDEGTKSALSDLNGSGEVQTDETSPVSGETFTGLDSGDVGQPTPDNASESLSVVLISIIAVVLVSIAIVSFLYYKNRHSNTRVSDKSKLSNSYNSFNTGYWQET